MESLLLLPRTPCLVLAPRPIRYCQDPKLPKVNRAKVHKLATMRQRTTLRNRPRMPRQTHSPTMAAASTAAKMTLSRSFSLLSAQWPHVCRRREHLLSKRPWLWTRRQIAQAVADSSMHTVLRLHHDYKTQHQHQATFRLRPRLLLPQPSRQGRAPCRPYSSQAHAMVDRHQSAQTP